jgi:hypothetical protein
LDEEAFQYAYPDLALEISDRAVMLQRVKAHHKRCRRCQLVADNHVWADRIIGKLLVAARKKKKASDPEPELKFFTAGH